MAQGGRQLLTRRTIHAGLFLGTLISMNFWLFTISSGTRLRVVGLVVFPLLFFMVTGFLYKLVFILIMKISYLAFGLIK